MKGIRFYEEFTNTSKKVSEGNVVAAIVENGIEWSSSYDKTGKPIQVAQYECISAVYFYPDSPCAGSAVALDYLSKRCKRIPEQKARNIHPQLFVYLDAANAMWQEEERKAQA